MSTWKHHGNMRTLSWVASLLLLCVAAQSCKDEYFYDDVEPDWLGASIYNYLEEQGNFTLFLKVIDDLDYAEVLSKTGSKTLFAANDEAFLKGIKDAWGLSSYDQLSPAQKKIILYNSMLDNAYLLEMMSSTAAASATSDPVEGRCLRQVTSSNIVDTIGYFYEESLPKNNQFWDGFREKGIRLAADGTRTMMVHFLKDQLYQNNIKTSDLEVLFNHRYSGISTEDAFIFDKKVIAQNVTCKNGYVHELDGLLIPPSNMAEEIRRNPKTQLFSRLLDRFSAPIKNEQLTEDFNRLYHYGDEASAETIYEKRYFTQGSDRGTSMPNSGFLSYTDDNGTVQSTKGSLLYDPGWNNYKSGTSATSSAENDMAAMFIPNDETLAMYFENGKGKALIERYGKPGRPLEENMDSIPLDVVQALVRNVMKTSFNSTVPSKFESIMNDARESMHVYEEDIDEVMICNNGAVYVMNEVYSPARYVAVIAPVMLSENTRIAYWAINQYEYDKYLLAMDSRFSFIVPTDDAFWYYDVATLKNANSSTPPSLYIFRYNPAAKTEAAKVYAEEWHYDPITRERLDSVGTLTTAATIKNLLQQMMEYYITVGDFQDGNKYHMTKGYGTVKVETGSQLDGNNKPTVEKLYGGYEVQNETGGYTPGAIYLQENGNTYFLTEGMIMPPTQSVYSVMTNNPEFSEYLTLAETPSNVAELLSPKTEKGEIITDSLARFFTFWDMGGLDYNVRTFNTYHYTVYVPTNDAIDEAHVKGLPYWEDVEDDTESVNESQATIDDNNVAILEKQNTLLKMKSDGASQAEIDALQAEIDALVAQNEQLATYITEMTESIRKRAMLILDFVRYHIQDNSVYVDNLPHKLVEGDKVYYQVSYETATLDTQTKRFSKVTVETKAGPYGGNTITVKGDIDEFDNTCYVVNTPGTEGTMFNIMTRDLELTGRTIETSSFAVVHQIDNFLVNSRIFVNGKFTTENE